MSQFIKEINRAYKSILTEQTPQDMGGLGAVPATPSAPSAPNTPAVPAVPSNVGGAPQEQPVETPAARSSSDAFLIGMIAKALLIDVDDDDKLKIVKYLKGLDEDSASAVEENLINIINNNDYQNIDEELEDIKISPKNSRKVLKFINRVMEDYVDTETSDSGK